MNKKWFPHVITIGAVILFAVLALACLESSPPARSSSGGGGGSYSGGSSSSSSSSQYTFTFINSSSHTVTVDGREIPPGGQATKQSNSIVFGSEFTYTPADLVTYSNSGDQYSGFVVTFHDK